MLTSIRANVCITASASDSFSGRYVLAIPITIMPLARADSIPAGASSITKHFAGGNPNRSAPIRYGSGCGFPFFTSSEVTRTSGTGSPQYRMRFCASRRDPEVTTPQRPLGIDFKKSAAPGMTVTPR